MHTINEHAPKSRIRMTHLHFVDWLEALCRLSQLKAMPTDDEIASDPHSHDACTYLLRLAVRDPAAYSALLDERSASWGRLQTAQPMERSPSRSHECA